MSLMFLVWGLGFGSRSAIEAYEPKMRPDLGKTKSLWRLWRLWRVRRGSCLALRRWRRRWRRSPCFLESLLFCTGAPGGCGRCGFRRVQGRTAKAKALPCASLCGSSQDRDDRWSAYGTSCERMKAMCAAWWQKRTESSRPKSPSAFLAVSVPRKTTSTDPASDRSYWKLRCHVFGLTLR